MQCVRLKMDWALSPKSWYFKIISILAVSHEIHCPRVIAMVKCESHKWF
jgi:hypothetical protein